MASDSSPPLVQQSEEHLHHQQQQQHQHQQVQFVQLTPSLLQALNLASPSASSITRLRLSHHSLTSDLSALASTPLAKSLRKLDLGHNNLGPLHDLKLHGMEVLEEVGLRGNRLKELEGLGLPVTVVKLDLGSNEIELGGGSLSSLATACPNLQHLNLVDNPCSSSLPMILNTLPSLLTLNGLTREEIQRSHSQPDENDDDTIETNVISSEVDEENESESESENGSKNGNDGSLSLVRQSLNSVLTSIDFSEGILNPLLEEDEEGTNDYLDASADAITAGSLGESQMLLSLQLQSSSPSTLTSPKASKLPLAKALASPEAAAFHLDNDDNDDNDAYTSPPTSEKNVGFPLTDESSGEIRGVMLLCGADESVSADEEVLYAENVVKEIIERTVEAETDEQVDLIRRNIYPEPATSVMKTAKAASKTTTTARTKATASVSTNTDNTVFEVFDLGVNISSNVGKASEEQNKGDRSKDELIKALQMRCSALEEMVKVVGNCDVVRDSNGVDEMVGEWQKKCFQAIILKNAATNDSTNRLNAVQNLTEEAERIKQNCELKLRVSDGKCKEMEILVERVTEEKEAYKRRAQAAEKERETTRNATTKLAIWADHFTSGTSSEVVKSPRDRHEKMGSAIVHSLSQSQHDNSPALAREIAMKTAIGLLTNYEKRLKVQANNLQLLAASLSARDAKMRNERAAFAAEKASYERNRGKQELEAIRLAVFELARKQEREADGQGEAGEEDDDLNYSDSDGDIRERRGRRREQINERSSEYYYRQYVQYQQKQHKREQEQQIAMSKISAMAEGMMRGIFKKVERTSAGKADREIGKVEKEGLARVMKSDPRLKSLMEQEVGADNWENVLSSLETGGTKPLPGENSYCHSFPKPRKSLQNTKNLASLRCSRSVSLLEKRVTATASLRREHTATAPTKTITFVQFLLKAATMRLIWSLACPRPTGRFKGSMIWLSWIGLGRRSCERWLGGLVEKESGV